MTGRAEVQRRLQQLDETFARARRLGADAELLSDFARYLCVLVSGFVEQATIALLLEYVRTHSDRRVQSYVVDRRFSRISNLNKPRLMNIVGSFDPKWRSELETFIVNEYEDALNGIVDLRNTVAHGRYAGGVTLPSVYDYYKRIKKIINRVADLLLPQPRHGNRPARGGPPD